MDAEDDIRRGFAETLAHCAMPGAVRITFKLGPTETGRRASRKSYGADDRSIGDDRPYEILKSCFNRLETCARKWRTCTGMETCDPEIHPLEVSLDLKTGRVVIGEPDEHA